MKSMRELLASPPSDIDIRNSSTSLGSPNVTARRYGDRNQNANRSRSVDSGSVSRSSRMVDSNYLGVTGNERGVKHARDMGFRICHCTPSGEIMVVDPKRVSANERSRFV